MVKERGHRVKPRKHLVNGRGVQIGFRIVTQVRENENTALME